MYHIKLILFFVTSIFTHSLLAIDLNSIADEQHLTVRGEVVQINKDIFILKTKQGNITVELDDSDPVIESKWLIVGDQVSVFGRMDKDKFEKRSIEASSVYIPKIDLYIFASAKDEETTKMNSALSNPSNTEISISGVITMIDNNSLTLKTLYGLLNINIATLKSKSKLNVGDKIYVEGISSSGFFSTNGLTATKVIKIITLKQQR